MVFTQSFKYLLFIGISAFVSFGYTQPNPSTKDEFDLFEEELKGNTPERKSTRAIPPDETLEQKASRLKEEIRSAPNSFGKIEELAAVLLENKEASAATSLLWKHIDKISTNGILTLAEAHLVLKEYGDSIRASTIVIAKNEKNSRAHTLKGNAHYLQKKEDLALDSYKAALEANPKYEPAYLGLVELYEKRTPPNLYELRILFQDMIKNLGKKSQYLQKLCEINTMDGVFESALVSCKEAIAKDSKQADAFVHLGSSYQGSGDDKKAEATFKKAARVFPKSELAQFTYGKLLEDSKNHIDAFKYYKLATEADSKAARSWLGLARTAFEVKKLEISLTAFRTACRLDKKTAAAFRKATTILRNNRDSQWLKQFESSSESCSR